MAVLMASLAGTAAVPAVAKAIPASIEETVIQGGLNAPRHLVLTEAGLVVTEAGTGGPVCPTNSPTRPATPGAGTSQSSHSPPRRFFPTSPSHTPPLSIHPPPVHLQ